MRASRTSRYSAPLCLVLALVAATLLTACGGEGSAKVFELRLAHHLPASAPAAVALEEWTKKIEAATNGQVRFTIFPSESLVKGRDVLAATQGGICDVAFINMNYSGEELSLNAITCLASLPVPTDDRGTEIWDKLWEEYPQMLAELARVQVLSKSISMTTSIHVKDKEIHVPDDIKDMKIAAMGDSLGILEAAGASPVNMPPGEWSLSAQKGVIEGCMAPIGVATDRNVQEVFMSHLDLGIGQGGNLVIMNLDRWNQLPGDVQTAFVAAEPELNTAIREANEQLAVEGWDKCDGQTIIKPTAEELKLWLACCEPAAQEWIKGNAGKAPSQEMYDYVLELISHLK